MPMRTFVPTDEEKNPVRDAIKRSVYCCVMNRRKLASGVLVTKLRFVTRLRGHTAAPKPSSHGDRRKVRRRSAPASTASVMKIHEYQAKAILARYGVPVPRGEVTFAAGDAAEIAKRLGTSVV